MVLTLLLAAAVAPPAYASHDAPTGLGFAVRYFTVPFAYTSYVVSWTPPADGLQESYKIQWKDSTQDWDATNRQKTRDKDAKLHGFLSFQNLLTDGTTYTFRVGAVKDEGESTEHTTWSEELTRTLRICTTSDNAITNATMPSGTNSNYTLLAKDCTYLLSSILPTLDPNGVLNWSDSLAISSWNGVQLLRRPRTVYGESGQPVRVVNLELAWTKLQGIVPPEFGGPVGGEGGDNAPLSQMEIIDLRSTQLTGGIPAELGGNATGQNRLDSLLWLFLDDNPLGGTIPGELGNLDTLALIWLRRAQLTGEIPAGTDANSNPTGLAKLDNWLVDLMLAGNQLTGEIPPDLGRLRLFALDLSDNQLTGEIPGELTSLPKNGDALGWPEYALEYLNLSNNRLTGEIPAGTDANDNPTGLAKLANLQTLYLYNNQLSGAIPSELGDIGSAADGYIAYRDTDGIEVLLNCNKLTGSAPAKLGDIESSEKDPDDNTKFVTLEKLGLSGNPGLTIPAALQSKAATQLAAGQTAVTCPAPPSAPGRGGDAPRRPRARLTASLSAAPDPVRVGGSVSYTLTVTNAGSGALSGLVWRSPELGVAQRPIGDGALAADAATTATFSFGPVTDQHLPGPIVVNVFADSDQTNETPAALAVAVQAAPPTPTPAPAPAPTPDGTDATTDATTDTAAAAASAPPDPHPAVSDLNLAILRAFYSTPDPPDPDLGHNILALQLTLPDGTSVTCDFLGHYLRTGGLARWGYATSEILEERPNTLTQYYQRGAVDCHCRDGQWRIERRLTWDFIGGGLFGAPDLGFEPHLLSDQPGIFPGPWGHRVSNFAIDGTYTGFLDFFYYYGGVPSFGYPKTEARRDDHPDAVLQLAGAETGIIRQYFQAAVFEFHPDDPDDPVKLGLAGDVLRDLLYPNQTHQRFASFHPAPILTSGEGYMAERVIWDEAEAQADSG